MTVPLFRSEVVEARAPRLYGDVSIAQPLAWRVLTWGLLAALAVGCVFLFSVSYTRVETVSGEIVLDTGVAPIVASRPGVLMSLYVKSNQHVEQGQPLARIQADEINANGRSSNDQALAALNRQDQELAEQTAQTVGASMAAQARTRAQISGIRNELRLLEQQLAAQRELLSLAETEIRLVQGVAAKGFISRRDMAAREELLVSRRLQLAVLEQTHAAKRAALADAEASISQVHASGRSEAAGMRAARAELAQRRVDVEMSGQYILAAPVSGNVTAIVARVGQPVTAERAIMTLVPRNAEMRAELRIPSRAAGFLRAGQSVLIAVDAFPYQQFGMLRGTIQDVSTVAVPDESSGSTAPLVYLAQVELPKPYFDAGGRRLSLLPGMNLTAQITVNRQSLIKTIFSKAWPQAE